MKTLTLTITEIDRLSSINKRLYNEQPLTTDDTLYLSKFLFQFSSINPISAKIEFDETMIVNPWRNDKMETTLDKWKNLFFNIPGFDFAPNCYILDNDSSELLAKNVLMIAMFAPSLSYNSITSNDAYEVRLKNDGIACFWFPSFEEAEKYPELYNFKGSWKEAYLLLIETLKKGWPMEEFPEELRKFLPAEKG
jgi:hypothetical protein